MKSYMTAEETAETLGIKRTTFYVYASRGMLRSEAVSDASREKRYLAAEHTLMQWSAVVRAFAAPNKMLRVSFGLE
jgi:predicted site-specific integrase-resolvase